MTQRVSPFMPRLIIRIDIRIHRVNSLAKPPKTPTELTPAHAKPARQKQSKGKRIAIGVHTRQTVSQIQFISSLYSGLPTRF